MSFQRTSRIITLEIALFVPYSVSMYANHEMCTSYSSLVVVMEYVKLFASLSTSLKNALQFVSQIAPYFANTQGASDEEGGGQIILPSIGNALGNLIAGQVIRKYIPLLLAVLPSSLIKIYPQVWKLQKAFSSISLPLCRHFTVDSSPMVSFHQ
jgi:hypothetical protein